MGEVKNLEKVTLQVVSVDTNLKKSSKTADILAENGIYDPSIPNGDVAKVNAFVRALYAASTRTVDYAYIIGRSGNIYQI